MKAKNALANFVVLCATLSVAAITALKSKQSKSIQGYMYQFQEKYNRHQDKLAILAIDSAAVASVLIQANIIETIS